MRAPLVYTIGKGRAPAWCRDKLMPYQRNDGRIGWEFHGYDRDYNLKDGDELIFKDGHITIRREAAR